MVLRSFLFETPTAFLFETPHPGPPHRGEGEGRECRSLGTHRHPRACPADLPYVATGNRVEKRMRQQILGTSPRMTADISKFTNRGGTLNPLPPPCGEGRGGGLDKKMGEAPYLSPAPHPAAATFSPFRRGEGRKRSTVLPSSLRARGDERSRQGDEGRAGDYAFATP